MNAQLAEHSPTPISQTESTRQHIEDLLKQQSEAIKTLRARLTVVLRDLPQEKPSAGDAQGPTTPAHGWLLTCEARLLDGLEQWFGL